VSEDVEEMVLQGRTDGMDKDMPTEENNRRRKRKKEK
jgi:hypothetical protein